MSGPKIEFRATIHDTPASLRLGGDEAFVTFVVPAQDVEHVVGLIALKKTPLKITVEVDSGLNEFKDLTKNGSAKTDKRTARRPTKLDSC